MKFLSCQAMAIDGSLYDPKRPTRLSLLALLAFVIVTVFTNDRSHAAADQCKEFPDGEYRPVQTSGDLLAQEFLETLSFDENGLTGIVCAEQIYHVSKTGKYVRAFVFDNGPDYFSDAEGLARYVAEDGRIGFVDAELNSVIPAQFKCAFPFRNGKARVVVFENGSEVPGTVYPSGQIAFENQSPISCTASRNR